MATRAAFLTASAAALAGCARHSGSSLLPGLSPSAIERAPSATPAMPIPGRVLISPIIGEARRFDGATAPPGWMKVHGQQLSMSEHRVLAAMLGKGGTRAPASFTLPAPKTGWIIAVAGTDPANARALAELHRGVGMKLGVSIEGLEVREAPHRFAPPAPAPAKLEPWFPGTAPTPEEIEAAGRANTEVVFPPRAQHYDGIRHAISP